MLKSSHFFINRIIHYKNLTCFNGNESLFLIQLYHFYEYHLLLPSFRTPTYKHTSSFYQSQLYILYITMNQQSYRAQTPEQHHQKLSLSRRKDRQIKQHHFTHQIQHLPHHLNTNLSKIEENILLNKKSTIIYNQVSRLSNKNSETKPSETNDYPKDNNNFQMRSFRNPFLDHKRNDRKAKTQVNYIAKTNNNRQPSFSANYSHQYISSIWNQQSQQKAAQQLFKTSEIFSQIDQANIEGPKEITRRSNNKISLKNCNKTQNNLKSSLLICLNYEHLKSPLFIQQAQQHPYFSDDYQNQSRNQGLFNSFGCSNSIIMKYGCQCVPKCFWINKWIHFASTSRPISFNLVQRQHLSNIEDNYNQIQKDVPRTYSQSQAFQTYEFLLWLKEVLVEYAKVDYQVGYAQGMNFIAAALVYHSYGSEDSKRIMFYIMIQLNFRSIYLNDMSLTQTISQALTQQLRRLSYDLYSHLTEQGVEFELFIRSWYFSMLGSFVPVEWMHLVIDKFIRRGFGGLNEIILTLLIYLKERLLLIHDNELLLAFTNHKLQQYAKWIDWYDLIAKSNNLMLQPFNC